MSRHISNGAMIHDSLNSRLDYQRRKAPHLIDVDAGMGANAAAAPQTAHLCCKAVGSEMDADDIAIQKYHSSSPTDKTTMAKSSRDKDHGEAKGNDHGDYSVPGLKHLLSLCETEHLG